MQHCKREYCNAGTRQWSQRGIYIRKASKAKNSEQIIIRSNDSRYRGYPKTEKNAIQQRGVVTIQEAVTGFLAEKENTIKLSSYLRYEQMLRKHILPSLGRVCVDQLSTKAFTSFLQQKQIDSELSQKTLKDIGTLLKGVLKYAETTFNCSSPAHGAKLPKYRQNMPEIFSDAEINSIANRVLDVPSILGIAILLTLNSGLRLGELCALRWSDIDFSSGVISVQRTVQRLTVDGVGKLVIQPPKSLSSLWAYSKFKTALLPALSSLLAIMSAAFWVRDIMPGLHRTRLWQQSAIALSAAALQAPIKSAVSPAVNPVSYKRGAMVLVM